MFTNCFAVRKIVRAKGDTPLKPRSAPAGSTEVVVVVVIVVIHQIRGVSMSEKKKKTHAYSFRLTDEEAAIFEEKIAASNMSKSEFFREVFINSNVNLTVKAAPSKDYQRLLFFTNKASNNLNQLAHKVNVHHLNGKVSERLYRKYLNTLISIRDILLSGVDNAD
ncbi:plasmid mobilization protein [Escherichia coli]|jgi:hypothetical protein|uniref:plasmid mobilization protein n=1 Tax=Escherichia coli TaxID=562 RepID=UPI001FCE69A6|nr:ribbon-helix-helix protein, CopG family [Escherichia coli]